MLSRIGCRVSTKLPYRPTCFPRAIVVARLIILMRFSPLKSLRPAVFILAFCARALAADAPHFWPTAPQFLPVTGERIAALPAAERAAWTTYFERSISLAAQLPKRAAFVTPDLTRLEGPGIPSKQSKGMQLRAAADWYATEPAQAVADQIVAAQSKAGGWTKSNDYTQTEHGKTGEADLWSGGTFDNNSTTSELRFLAQVNAAVPNSPRAAAWRESALRGVRYIFAAQYPNGGFPQVYPLAGGYHDAITYNDNAMLNILVLLTEIADGKSGFGFVPAPVRTQAAAAVERGINCILATQMRGPDGKPTVWCQQHDAITLKPCAARNFEPAAACTSESASLARYLMGIPNPSPAVVASVQGAIAWLERVVQRDVLWSRQSGAGQLVAKAGAAPIWARMYEIGTNKPIFGDRDRTVHYDVNELSSERRNGYGWYGTWPVGVLEAYKTWPGRSK